MALESLAHDNQQQVPQGGLGRVFDDLYREVAVHRTQVAALRDHVVRTQIHHQHGLERLAHGLHGWFIRPAVLELCG